jgi:hypothetical protein
MPAVRNFLLSSGIVALVLFVSSCDRPPTKPATPKETAKDTPAADSGPPEGQKTCFQCNGQGTTACAARGCVNGKADCPGSCMRLNRGSWIHMTVAGHDPSELWQKFPYGRGGYQAFNQNHVGEVVVYENGMPVNKGKCPTCGGTTKVNCSACQGTGKQTCSVCQGSKYVPLAWKPNDYPWLNSQPDLIRLKDGRFYLGKIVKSDGDDRLIKTRDSKFVHVSARDIDESSPGAKTL